MNAPTAPNATAQRQRRTLVLLALLFLLPVLIAFFLYYGANGWQPVGRTNHGELISPARPLPALSLPMPGGEQTSPQLLRDKWSVVYVNRGACDDACRKALYETRQVRLSLNEKRDRVQRIFLYSGTCCEQPFFQDEHPDLIAAATDNAAGAKLLAELPQPSAEQRGRLYIVDPLGNVMMSYPPGAAPKGLLSDLRRLLKLSHIG